MKKKNKARFQQMLRVLIRVFSLPATANEAPRRFVRVFRT